EGAPVQAGQGLRGDSAPGRACASGRRYVPAPSRRARGRCTRAPRDAPRSRPCVPPRKALRACPFPPRSRPFEPALGRPLHPILEQTLAHEVLERGPRADLAAPPRGALARFARRGVRSPVRVETSRGVRLS